MAANGPFPALGPLLEAKPVAQAYEEKKQREAGRSALDYVGPIFREDSPVDGFVARLAGESITPDPDYNVYDPNTWKELTTGLPEQFHRHLTEATSPSHALYIRSRLDDKIADQQVTGDMSFWGRLGAGAVVGLADPANLALGFGVGTLAKTGKAAATAGRTAANIGAGAAGGYAFEKLRQSVSFEDSETQALLAGLTAAAFTAPFALLNVREARAVQQAAQRDLDLMASVRAGQEHGVEPPPPTRNYAESVLKGEATESASDPLGDSLEAAANRVSEAKRPMDASTPKADAIAAAKGNDGIDAGTDVWWPAGKDGEVHSGTVLEVVKRGESSDPSMGSVVSGGDLLRIEDKLTGNIKEIHRADLSTDSPLYAAPQVDGFKAGSVGSGQGSPIDVDTTAMSGARVDIYAKLNKSPNAEVKQLTDVLVKDAIQKSKHYAQGRTASEEKKQLQRVVGGNFHMTLSSAADDAAKKLNMGRLRRLTSDFDRQFDESVGRLVRGDTDVLTEGVNPQIAQELEKAANAARKLYSTMLEEAKKAGVKGVEGIEPDAQYLNRVWDVQKAYALMKDIDRKTGTPGSGKAAVVNLIASAMQTNAARKSNQTAAAQFFEAIQRLEYDRRGGDLLMHAQNAAVLRQELNAAGLSRSQIDALIDTLFEVAEVSAGDKGVAPNLKFRFKLNEAASIALDDGRVIRLSDLLENNTRVLADRYMNSMGGHIGLAKNGIRSRADFEARLRAADVDHEANITARDSTRYADEKQLLTDMYDHIVGRPMSMQTFNVWDRVGNTMRGFTRSLVLGQLGFTSALELPSKVGLMTTRALWMQMPSFADMVRAVRSGQRFDKELAQDVLAMTGFGTESAAGHLRTHKVTEYTYDKALTRVENLSNTASHFTDVVSGNRFVTAQTRNLASRVLIQKLFNYSNGTTKLTEDIRTRLVGSGLDRDNIDAVLADLRAHTVSRKTAFGDTVEAVRWEDWGAKNPNTYHEFITALNREVRTVIQDHDIGETPWFMHSTMGKYFFELKTFMSVAYAKNFLAGIHYRDRATAQTWIASFATQSLGYVLQTSMNFAHNPDELDKRLTIEKIAKAGMARMGEMGVASVLWDSTAGNLDASFQLTGQGLTANTDNRNAFLPPSAMVLSKAASGAQAMFGSTFGGETFTQKDFKNLAGSALPNMYFIRNLTDALSSNFDKSELRRVPN